MPTHSAFPTLFVTATDTGVGKTAITGALLIALQNEGHSPRVCKPVETGVDPSAPLASDVNRLRSLLIPIPPSEEVCLYSFGPPLAPLACAKAAGTFIDLSRMLAHIRKQYQEDSYVLIEGAGGLLTPLTSTHSIKDLITELQSPSLIITHTDLGAINHSLLTVRTLQHEGLPIHGLVLNNSSPMTKTTPQRLQRQWSVDLIRELCPVRVFGPIAYEKTFSTDWKTGVHTLSRHPEIQRLVNSLLEKDP